MCQQLHSLLALPAAAGLLGVALTLQAAAGGGGRGGSSSSSRSVADVLGVLASLAHTLLAARALMPLVWTAGLLGYGTHALLLAWVGVAHCHAAWLVVAVCRRRGGRGAGKGGKRH